ncbi:MAG: TenA family protein [Pseudomonadota bacterium]
MREQTIDFAGYVASRPGAGFSEWLRASNRGLWADMVGHRFCHDMAADQLPDAVFIRYLRYEHAFVRGAIGIFAHALAKAPTPADQDHLIGVLVGLAGEQEAYFRRSFAAIGVDAEPLDPDKLPQAARGLRDAVVTIAAADGFAEILAAMLAAEWMYLTWCEEAHARGPQQPGPLDWIELHLAADFRAQVTWLRRRLDELGPGLPATRQGRCADHFGRVLELEIAFHEAPYAEA